MKPELFNAGGLRVLVVDDNADDRRLLSDCLRTNGYRVYIAEDGMDGAEKANVLLPDLILMDVRMPVCGGIAACRLLKANPRTAGIPLIFLTAADQVEDRVQGLLEGAIDYIGKPFNFDEVRLRVGIHLRVPRQTEPPQLETGELPEQVSNFDQMVFRATHRLLHDDLARTPELTTLAHAVGTNTRRLNDAFRNCSGTTVFDYLREARMAQARKMLQETGLAIQVIANDLGYESQANFATAFRTRFGLSPRDYRKSSEVQATEQLDEVATQK
jgi:DNA-binding response OmpR family regulator